MFGVQFATISMISLLSKELEENVNEPFLVDKENAKEQPGEHNGNDQSGYVEEEPVRE